MARKQVLVLLFGLLLLQVLVGAFSTPAQGSRISVTPTSASCSRVPIRVAAFWKNSNDEASMATTRDNSFFIRKALPAEIGAASDILTDAFFANNTNFITYQWERLTTYLSLESNFPKPGDKRHVLLVACRSTDGKVLGLAEVDDKPPPRSELKFATPRPYMYNVAVHRKRRGQGIAKALVKACEKEAKKWGKPQVFLKVRENNEAAVGMYKKLKYNVRSRQVERLNNQYTSLLVMSKDIARGKLPHSEQGSKVSTKQ